MIQFTQEDLEKIQYKSDQYPAGILKLKDEVDEVFKRNITVPKTGIANWTLYYYCPDCSVKLAFDWNSPKEHICPCCKRAFYGEPYDSSWWGLANSRNYNEAFSMSMIWLVTGEEAYARKAADILLEYAAYYPEYEIHGDIPYNGPGRSGAQTLDEANFQRTLAMAYDILSDYLTEEERHIIRDNMLLPGAEFLLEHRHRQLHNHEVIINSAIGVIGILFNKKEYIDAALYDDYGLIYQLEHGMLANHMWFEGAFGYHFYALTSFFAFEKFALHTPFGNIHHPNYRHMMEVLCDYLEPDFSIPMLNDTNYGHLSGMKELYEFAYREIGGDKLAFILNTAYNNKKRNNNLEAFFYGADEIAAAVLPLKNYHTELNQPGHTILRGRDGRYLLLKHDSYGGEHDHYDRLAISYCAFGRPVASDLGTTGYGAKLHYDYYKNTGTHNTLTIGEENQAPVNGRLTRYEEQDGVIYAEAEADWTAPYQLPDSFNIVQWKEENYRPVRMCRKIAWTDEYFVEVFTADRIPEGLTADWTLHVSGTELPVSEGLVEAPENYFVKKPLKYLHTIRMTSDTAAGTYERTYQDEEVSTTVYGMNCGQTLISALGPDNPSTGDISYLIERQMGEKVLYAHVIESWKATRLTAGAEFSVNGNLLEVRVSHHDGRGKTFAFFI